MYYESYEQIAAIFLDTADYEKEQAKVFFKLLEDGETLEITSAFPPGIIEDTKAISRQQQKVRCLRTLRCTRDLQA
jgi:rubrerythrin